MIPLNEADVDNTQPSEWDERDRREPAMNCPEADTSLLVTVSAELHDRIIKICAVRGLPVNQIVREILEQGFPD